MGDKGKNDKGNKEQKKKTQADHKREAQGKEREIEPGQRDYLIIKHDNT